MLFASAAVAGGIIQMYGSAPNLLLANGLFTFGRTVTYEIMNVYAMKMAGVFMVSTSTLALRTGILPRWMSIFGLVLAVFLLFSLGLFYWSPLVFPLWVLLISTHILLANRTRPESKDATSEAAS